ncbi:MAG: hypothetical protein JWN41_304 [Thermoleophilia bacterium]|nr:hypothetical protein [Thermoleophilia bacterium]
MSQNPITVGRAYIGCEVDGVTRTADELAPAVRAVLDDHGVTGATMWSGLGLYEGSIEPTIVVEIVGTDDAAIAAIATALRTTLRQESVPWTCTDVRSG